MMKRLSLMLNRWFPLCVVVLLAFGATWAQAVRVEMYTEEVEASVWNSKLEVSGALHGNVAVDPPTPFDDGKALRIYDYNTGDKAELQGQFSGPIFEPFRIDFQSYNQSPTNGNESAHFRMANVDKHITSEKRCAFSLNWQDGGEFSATYDPGVVTNSVPSVESDPLVGVHDINILGNGSTNETYAYTIFGQNRTLDPLAYDVWIDGVLLNSDAEFTNGLPFVVNYDDPDRYFSENGLQRYGIVGADTSGIDLEYLFDNIIFRYGETLVPEAPQVFTSISTTSAFGFEFSSETGTTYVLQTSTNAADAFPIWENAGMEVDGDGGTQVLFDPAGYDAGRAYRVIEAN